MTSSSSHNICKSNNIDGNISKAPQNKNRKVFFLGDSIVKYISDYDIPHQIENCRVYVKDLSGTKTKCMKDYAQPITRENSDHVLIHVGNNDLPTRRQPDFIAEDIIQLALNSKTNSCDVLISNIVVNHKLNDLCKEQSLHHVQHSNSINTRHLNGSKLHLDTRGTKILFTSFVKAISNILLSQSITHSLHDSNCVHMIDEYKVEPMNMNGIESLKAILRKRNLNRIVVAHLNINSLRNKFDYFIEQIKGNIGILVISETKLDSSFPAGQFFIMVTVSHSELIETANGVVLCYM